MKKTNRLVNLSAALFLLTALLFQVFSATGHVSAAYTRIRLTPASVTTTTGTNFSVNVVVETDQSVNAVKIWLDIPDGLTLVSEDNSVSAFPTKYPAGGSPRDYEISQSSSAQEGNKTGNLTITRLNLRGDTTGTRSIGVHSKSYVINFPSTTNLVTSWGGGTSYTINSPSPPPTGGGGGGGTTRPPTTGGSTTRPPSSKPTASVSTPQSQSTPSGLQISDFEIKDIGYRSAVATWKTNKPANSSVRFGENPDELSNELKDEGQKTDHRIVIEGENVKAGRLYFVNISSSDGSEPAQLDGEFSTTAIPVLVRVLDTEGNPVADASAYTESAEGTTNADGEATLDLPEGDITVSAVKDDLYGEIKASILIPEADSSMQEVMVTLSVITTAGDEGSGSSGAVWLYVFLVLLLIGLGIWGFIFWKRRRASEDDGYYGDPLVNSYPTTPLPGTIDTQTNPNAISDPSLLPSPEQDYVPHYQSLPDLLKTETPSEPVSRFDTEPQDMFEKANTANEEPVLDNPFADKVSDNKADFSSPDSISTDYTNPFDNKAANNSLDNFSDNNQDFNLDASTGLNSGVPSPSTTPETTQSEDGTLIINHEK